VVELMAELMVAESGVEVDLAIELEVAESGV